jgi:peptide/nickel transport system substrate-binding protein
MDSDLTRRQLMTRGGQGLALLGAGGLLAACGSNATNGGTAGLTSPGGEGKPVKGGKLTVGMISGGSSETLDPAHIITLTDGVRSFMIYEYLFRPGLGQNFETAEPRLATSAEPNKDATIWTVNLRKGVKWHDGKPFTADDVVWSINSWSGEGNYASAFANLFIDFKGVRKRDQYTVEIPLKMPVAELPALLMQYNLAIIPNGATEASISKHPIGTGPFKFVSFKPGSQSIFVRNPDYWEDNEKPYVDELVVNSTFQDESSRYNALLGGEIDVAPVLPVNFAHQLASNSGFYVLSSPSGQSYSFSMRTDKPPFNDPRVLEAMKTLCNRQELIDGVFPGYAQVGNDLLGRHAPYFAEDIKPPAYDPEKAKSLLKAAGQENLAVTLATTVGVPGFAESATLYAQQAEAAGVKVNVEQESYATYFTEPGGFLSRSFGESNGFSTPSLMVIAASYFLEGAPYEETGWARTAVGGKQQGLLRQAIGELDETKAADLWHQVQTEWHDQSGFLVWSYLDFVDGSSSRIKGLSSGIADPLNTFQLASAWIVS